MSESHDNGVDTGHEQRPHVDNATEMQSSGAHIPVVTIAAILLVIIGLAFLAYSLSSKDEKPMYPLLPTATNIASTMDYTPAILGFPELNADPTIYRGLRIQVSGAFTPIDAADCLDYSGPNILWSLVAEDLQLNAIGFENLLTFLSPGTEMTVLGIWTAYHGPVGCGKQPPDETVWYLAVERILEPNPLIGINGSSLTMIPGEPLPTLSPLETSESRTPELTPTNESLLTGTPTPTVESLLTIQATPSPNLTSLPVTPLLTPGATAGLTTTPGLGVTPGVTPTINLSVTPEPTSGLPGATVPPLPTSTPSGPGYPGQPTPTATTPGGYP